MEWLLTRGIEGKGAGVPPIRYRIECADNEHVREDVVWGGAGESFPIALTEMLNLARAGLFVDVDGTWVVYDLAATPIEAQVGVWHFDDPLRAEVYGTVVSTILGARWEVSDESLVVIELQHAHSRRSGDRLRVLAMWRVLAWR